MKIDPKSGDTSHEGLRVLVTLVTVCVCRGVGWYVCIFYEASFFSPVEMKTKENACIFIGSLLQKTKPRSLGRRPGKTRRREAQTGLLSSVEPQRGFCPLRPPALPSSAALNSTWSPFLGNMKSSVHSFQDLSE